ncbi:MAG TPA: MFS transporter, partial [Caulobacteraceae bacterium]|nr:MFS transporter [Caulobacteraceae bacterium]
MTDAPSPPATARDLLRQRDYLFFWASRWLGALGIAIQSVSMGWQVYALSRQASLSINQASFNVSLIGLITFAPLFFLALPAGMSADRYDRKRIMIGCYVAEMAPSAILAAAEMFHFASVPLLLAVAVIFGASRAFFYPALSALGPMLVPRELLPRAIAWNSLAGQFASIIGPALAGLLLAMSAAAAFQAAFFLYLAALISISCVRGVTRPRVQPGSRWALVQEGLAYVWTNKIVVGAISLDLCAVLLGGATALLPAFARDVLKVGPEGFGLLRSAPSAGAAIVAIYLSINPIRTRAGIKMFFGVALYSAATIVFGLSRTLWLSVGAMATLGAADMLSVFVRQTLVQLVTPDAMRGRVGAVTSLFVSASNELGEFRGGLVARFIGPVAAVIYGGVGSLIVTGLWARLFPALRRA